MRVPFPALVPVSALQALASTPCRPILRARPSRNSLSPTSASLSLRTAHAGRTSNTLTLKYERQNIGIRKVEESVLDLFMHLMRPGYPSAYVYNTGQWHKFQDTLLVPCFSLSEAGRHRLVTDLIQFGLDNLKASVFLGRDTPRV